MQTVSRVLAEPRRFALLRQIASQESTPCSALEAGYSISPATLSHHLKELQAAGLIEVEREGRCMKLSLCREVWEAYLRALSEI